MEFDLYKDVLNIAFAIAYIGRGRKVTLWYKQTGEFMVISGSEKHYPTYQGEIDSFDYKSSIKIPKDAVDEFAKYAAIDLIDAIYIEFQRDEQQEDIQIH
ncbi:hypothetical protein [Francisella sp. SYW-9]|uniref:hypothetical protein n=1 Tax=Francisella sp. SYW-9 TaxID=2610888 RepID=UPI00123E3C8D|nr:hypothetical protein [Francisella sp. SYW-9]